MAAIPARLHEAAPNRRLAADVLTAMMLVVGCTSMLHAGRPVHAQQIPDTSFVPSVSTAAFEPEHGPRVAIDEAHFNFHTADGRYAPFAQLLRRDGFVVSAGREPFSEAALADVDILVVANALNERNVEEWSLPTPSAFKADEIAAVRRWVERGGALLLIADHMPFGGAAADLAAAFGLAFTNGYASRPVPTRGFFVFNRADGSLADHPIARGGAAPEAVQSVATFTGQAFSATDARPVFVLASDAFLLMPTSADGISADTPRVPAGGLLQGATTRVGDGRVAAFGEAAMFSAQLAGPQRAPMGMNSPGAEQNGQFVLNVMHWLAGLLPD